MGVCRGAGGVGDDVQESALRPACQWRVWVARLSCAVLAAGALPGRAAPPPVTFELSPALDTTCALVRGASIQTEWRDELAARMPELEALWGREGPAWLEAAEAITGQAVLTEPAKVHLTLCDVPSQAMVGISVNMRYALRSFVSAPVPLRYKLDTAFHELLHGLIARQDLSASPLLAAQAGEPGCVRQHLHLLALQKAVLLRLQQAEAWAQVVAIDSQLPSACYRRAWAIVNATPQTHQAYVAELRR